MCIFGPMAKAKAKGKASPKRVTRNKLKVVSSARSRQLDSVAVVLKKDDLMKAADRRLFRRGTEQMVGRAVRLKLGM